MERTVMPTEEEVTAKLRNIGIEPTEDLVFAYKAGFVHGGATREEVQRLIRQQHALALDARKIDKQAKAAIESADRVYRQGEELRRLAGK